jgi:hypothetical protein
VRGRRERPSFRGLSSVCYADHCPRAWVAWAVLRNADPTLGEHMRRTTVLLVVSTISGLSTLPALAIEQCVPFQPGTIPATALQHHGAATLGPMGHCGIVPCSLEPTTGQGCWTVGPNEEITATYCQVGQDAPGRAPCGPGAPTACRNGDGSVFDNFGISGASYGTNLDKRPLASQRGTHSRTIIAISMSSL